MNIILKLDFDNYWKTWNIFLQNFQFLNDIRKHLVYDQNFFEGGAGVVDGEVVTVKDA